MKRIQIAAISAAAVLATAPLAEAAPFDFKGLYLGVHGGVIDNEVSFDHVSGDISDTGVIGGVQFGYNNINTSGFMWGLEIDLSLNDAEAQDTCPYSGLLDCEIQASPLATLRPRVGYATGDFLVYVTGGVVGASYDIVAFDDAGNRVDDANGGDFGWTVGGGVEYMIGDTVGVKAEYRFMRFNDIEFETKFPDTDTGNGKFVLHSVMAGLNWHF